MSTLSRVAAFPPFLRDMLSSPPRRGEGLHRWLFCVARHLHVHLPADEIVKLLKQVAAHSGYRRGEIEEAVESSKRCAWGKPQLPGTLYRARPAWPQHDPVRRAELVKSGGGVGGLLDASPVNLAGIKADTEDLIDQLMPGNRLLCCGQSPRLIQTKPREEWRGQLARQQFIVPSPMRATHGLTQQGKRSERCSEIVGPRQYIVVEFDGSSKDDQATLHLHLACHAPLVMVVDSGNESLHGWFHCGGATIEEICRFFAYAVRLGADPATFTACQLVRMPGGTRDTGQLQRVLFFNPAKIR
ncbi:hypothetical protein K0B96_08870 [Horticoccus luteus]|uniref:Uncharacterized protein n=1 Tax=Horticoccus luteus TaxID=2862869 RepID=A0A8F9XLH0_9BACT|nr:hypothetical protein [Horticoccus luteus]QYM80693.1 hypothetical protein K0B96_08870 [Horticoccus luteus]